MFSWGQLQTLAGKWSAFMGTRIFESSLVLILVGVIWLAFRRRISAHTGYWLFLLVFFKLVIPGPVTINKGVWRDLAGEIKKISTAPPPIPAKTASEAADLPAAVPPPQPGAAGISEASDPITVKSAAESSARKGNSLPSLLTLLMLVWGGSVLFMLIKFAINQQRVRGLIRRSEGMNPESLPLPFDRLKEALGIKKTVTVLSSEELASPVILGILRPVLVVPGNLFTRYSPSQTKWILLHELSHIKRFDNLVYLFQKLVQMLFFLYPGVWIAGRMIDRQREYACDDAALEASRSSRRDCGRAFLNLAIEAGRAPLLTSASCSGFHSSQHNIRRRLMRILDGSRRLKTRLSLGGSVLVFGMALLLGLFGLGNGTPGFSKEAGRPGLIWGVILKDQEPPQSLIVPLPGLPEGAVKLEMVLIKAGTFVMGFPDASARQKNRAWPPHKVTITRDFYMGKFEITQAQWEAVAGKHRSYFRGKPDHPVERVSWRKVGKFLKRINALDLGTFRLPTEAEWEYACRAGTQTRFSFGDSLHQAGAYMWWADNNIPRGTKKVGLKLPNPWGLHDMHGNVSEWCFDYWGEVSDSGPEVDPRGPKKGSSLISFLRNRVFRGGGYFYPAGECRSDFRAFEQESDYHASVGFRVVMEIPSGRDRSPVLSIN